jgi:3-isopropylmalate/(R)-2-methylmalate dehydratase large subunit
MKTLFDKIWDKHIVKTITEGVDVVFIDQHFIHEVTSPQAFNGLREKGVKVFRPERNLATADHNVPTINQHLPIKDPASLHQVESLTKNCKEFGIDLFGIGHKNQGIVHVIGPDLGKTQPGMTIVCGDSHTSTHGAFGAIAFGIGTTQVEQVLASQCLVLNKPQTMKIELNGLLNKGVTAKDVILYIISKLGTEGGTGYFVEYVGNVFSEMSMEERMTICNMSIEMGARGGMVGIDQTTISYVQSRVDISDQKTEAWKALNTDEGTEFDKAVSFSATDIYPMITVGTAPDTGITIGEKVDGAAFITEKAKKYMGFDGEDNIDQQEIDFVFIGSCTNGRIEDLRAAAGIVKGHEKAKKVKAWVVPGSMKVREEAINEGLDQIFIDAGFEFREPGCSACLAMNDDKIPFGAICISTSNRNFEGRQGEGAKTLLASPITAAASALTGRVTDPTKYLN